MILEEEYVLKNINYMEQFIKEPFILRFSKSLRKSIKRDGINDMNVEIYKDLVKHFDNDLRGE